MQLSTGIIQVESLDNILKKRKQEVRGWIQFKKVE